MMAVLAAAALIIALPGNFSTAHDQKGGGVRARAGQHFCGGSQPVLIQRQGLGGGGLPILSRKSEGRFRHTGKVR